MGRNKTPNSLLAARGSRKVRNEPAPAAGKVAPTRPLSEEAQGAWNRICEQLEIIGALSPTFADFITIAAEAIGTIEVASRDINARGQISITERGETKNPSFTIMTTSQGVAFKYLSALGLSPTSIGKLTGTTKDEANPFTDL